MKYRTFAELAFGIYGSAVSVHNIFHDGQTEPRSATFAAHPSFIGFIKPFEDEG
ncbi:hypothetical protein D1872_341370 [compost metagenome]